MANESNEEMMEGINRMIEEDEEDNSVLFLSELADRYVERAEKSNQWPDYFKAHGLYNACGKREPAQNSWYEKAYDVECKYYHAYNRESSKMNMENHQGVIDFLMRSLMSIRTDINQLLSEARILVTDFEADEERDAKKEIRFCRKIKLISEICCERMVSFMAEVMVSAEKLFGQPPCGYAVVAIGSLAKSTVTPYSDVEYLFLIEKEEYEHEFERLAVTSYFVINNLRESNLKVYDIKELKDRFKDNTKCGFEIDGLSAKAGYIPTGHGPDTKTCNKFIKTVERLVFLYDEILASPKEEAIHADLTAMLASTIFICGNRNLYDDLKCRLDSSKPNEARQRASLQMLQEDVKKHSFMPKETPSKINNVKGDFFRFPSIVLYDLKIICQIQATIVWEVIEELKSSQKISLSVASSLEFAMCAAQYMRLSTYSMYESQNDKISVLPTTTSTKDLARFPQGLFSIMCHHLNSLKKLKSLVW